MCLCECVLYALAAILNHNFDNIKKFVSDLKSVSGCNVKSQFQQQQFFLMV